jgi:hypothetical protein
MYMNFFFFIADPCIKSNGAPGICMHNDICKIVYSQKPPTYKSCSSNNVNCCPKIPDRELIPTGGQVYTNGGIVETAIVRKRDESGYPPDLYSYIFYLPKRPKNDSRHYEYWVVFHRTRICSIVMLCNK